MLSAGNRVVMLGSFRIGAVCIETSAIEIRRRTVAEESKLVVSFLDDDGMTSFSAFEDDGTVACSTIGTNVYIESSRKGSAYIKVACPSLEAATAMKGIVIMFVSEGWY